MYGDRAPLYDLLYSSKNYATEAETLHHRLLEMGIPDGAKLLDGGCGSGLHLEQLARWYQVCGFDLAPEMLDLARKRLPTSALWQDDLASFQVEEPVDVAVSLFSAIGYLLDEAALRASAACFHRALRPGGILMVEPWLAPTEFRAGRPFAQTHMDADVALSRVSVSGRQGDISTITMAWTIARRDQTGIEHFVEEHRLWLCPPELFERVFREAGFDTTLERPGLATGRGLLVGRRC
jgi:SAM-dependent methyltransferase